MDFFEDPEYPDRPQHQDFWRLVSAVNYIDGQALEGGKPVGKIIGDFIDLESLVYMADQRILRTPLREIPAYHGVFMALYLDAFSLGCRFTQEGRE